MLTRVVTVIEPYVVSERRLKLDPETGELVIDPDTGLPVQEIVEVMAERTVAREVELTPEEEAAVRAEWEANDPTRRPPPHHVFARDIVSWFETRPALWVQVLAAASAQEQGAIFLDLLRTRGEKPIDLDSPTFAAAWTLMEAAIGKTDAGALMTALRAEAR